MNLNSFPTQHITDDEYNLDPNFFPNYHSSSSVSCHDFFSSSRGFYDHPQLFHQVDEINNHAYGHGGSSTNKIENDDLRLSLWGKEDEAKPPDKAPDMSLSSSKKIKSLTLKITTTPLTIDQKPSSLETDQFSSSNINSSLHSPIRVCTDCNTTKTPLWRSGPKGPKSLCNACGIRQRKARRALAAATAVAAVGTNQATNPKLQHHKAVRTARSGQSLQVKKRCKTKNLADGESISAHGNGEKKKVCFEDMLINLSKKLAVVHTVFPEEEKDAAILLMALSYGLIHG